MKKIKWIIISILSLIVIYFGIYIFQNYIAKKTFQEYNKEKLGEESKSYLIRCNLNILNPQYAYTFFLDNKGEISFENPNNIFPNKNDWEKSYIGGTTVQNTTFKNLLSMVKDDCYQFQKDYNWAETWGTEKEKTELRWKWSRSETEEEKREEKEKEEQERKAFEKMLKEKGMTEEEYRESQKLTSEEKEFQDKILKEYGF